MTSSTRLKLQAKTDGELRQAHARVKHGRLSWGAFDQAELSRAFETVRPTGPLLESTRLSASVWSVPNMPPRKRGRYRDPD
jgi:hypothetical protein